MFDLMKRFFLRKASESIAGWFKWHWLIELFEEVHWISRST